MCDEYGTALLIDEVKTMTSLEAIEKAARALLNDIECMRANGHELDAYGPFSEWESNNRGDRVRIEWPNLTISAAALAKALESLTP